ncbi:MAG TPA: multicopper oxidase domain-containing protein [Nitrososphaera sp.]
MVDSVTLEAISRGWALALAVSVIALVAVSSILFAFQPSVSSRTTDQVTTMAESLAPKLNSSILLIANENVLRIAPDNDLYPGGLWYSAMTFNGTIPGPLITANQGDILTITLKNEGKLAHSLNFHAGFGPNQALSGVVSAGQNRTWTMKVNYPGSFLYHCDGDNLNGIWEHIADGMYGGIVVHPPNEEAARDFYVAFSEIYDTNAHAPFAANQSPAYNDNSQAVGSFDIEKFIARKPDLIVTNGMAFRYVPLIGTEAKILLNGNAEAFHVKTGELTRWYLFNAGPRNNIAFNFGAGLVKEAMNNNNNLVNGGSASGSASSSTDRYDSETYYDEVINIPPGSGTVIEVTFPEPGTYFGNDHDVGTILYGAGFVVIAD